MILEAFTFFFFSISSINFLEKLLEKLETDELLKRVAPLIASVLANLLALSIFFRIINILE